MPVSILRTDWSKMVIACIINMLAVSTVFMTQSIFLELSEFFKINLTQARFSFSVVSLSYAAGFFILGPAADKFDLPKIAVSGVLLLAMTVVGASYTNSFDTFMIFMAFMGICAASIPASMFPLIAKTSSENKLAIYMGSLVASGTLGVIIGRVAMGILTSMFGWQASFRIIFVVLLILAALTFVSLVEANDGNSGNRTKLISLYTNTIRLLFNPKIISLLLTGFSLFVGFLGMVTFLTYRLIDPPFNFTSGEVGWISFAGITALIAPFAGSLSRKIGIYKIIFSALLICLLSFQLMGWFDSVSLTALALLLLFLGIYACQPLVFLLIGQNAPRESIGSASALYNLFCIGGGSLSSIFLGPIWRSYGWHGITIHCTFSLFISLSIMVVMVMKEKGCKRGA